MTYPTAKSIGADHVGFTIVIPEFDLYIDNLIPRRYVRKIEESLKCRIRHVDGVIDVDLKVDGTEQCPHGGLTITLMISTDAEVRGIGVKLIAIYCNGCLTGKRHYLINPLRKNYSNNLLSYFDVELSFAV